MGFTYTIIKVVKKDIDLLVDTGASFTILPKAVLGDLGVKPVGKRNFRTADGRIIEREYGQVEVEILGLTGYIPVVFGEEGDNPVLGVSALEWFGLEIDPNTKQIKPAILSLSRREVRDDTRDLGDDLP